MDVLNKRKILQNNINYPFIQIQFNKIKMRRTLNSRSQINITPKMDRSTSQRMFYVNDQLRYSKDITTIFHSPYKDGKRNSNYTNPTFLSSNLFYNEQQANKQSTPKHNLVYNKNQKSRKQLYDKRMQKADHLTTTIHEAAANDIVNRDKTRKVNDQSLQPMGRSRSNLRNDKNQQLVKQLQLLIKYREQDQKKQSTSRAYTEMNEDAIGQTPIYIQKNRIENQERANYQNKKNLQDWMAISDRIRQMKDSANQQHRKTQTKAMDTYIMSNAQRKYQKQMQSRRNAGMLANILKQQIKQAQNRKEKQKRQRVNFY